MTSRELTNLVMKEVRYNQHKYSELGLAKKLLDDDSDLDMLHLHAIVNLLFDIGHLRKNYYGHLCVGSNLDICNVFAANDG